jgi:hypothetical protein
LCPDTLHRLYPVQVRHVQVHQNYVGTQARYTFHRFPAVCRFSYDLEITSCESC